MKLYIGNIPYSATESELREALAEFEPIQDLYYPMDRETGQPRGFAFVTFPTREAGEEAMKQLDGAEFSGRPLRVNEAEERRGGGGGGGGGRSGGPRGGGGRRDDFGGGGGRRDDWGGGGGGKGSRKGRGNRGGGDGAW
ncbi:MAG: RNA-binding protein [Verrucomicrobiota bacterium]